MKMWEMKNIFSFTKEFFDIDRFWEIFRAYIVTLFMTFILYKYFLNQGYEIDQVKFISGIFFVIFLFLYLSSFDTRILFVRRFSVSLLNLVGKYRKIVYLILICLIVLSVRSSYLNQDWMQFKTLRFFVALPLSIFIGLPLGILLSSNNLSRMWVDRSVPLIILFILFLFFVLSSICLYAGTDQYILFRISILIILITFLVMHLYIKFRIWRMTIIEINVADLHEVPTSGRPVTKYYNWIRDGKVVGAFLHLMLNRSILYNQLIEIERKDCYKVMARILYRWGWYRLVLRLVERARKKEISSDVFTSLKALSCFQLGKDTKALETLTNAYRAECKKPIKDRDVYFAFNLGYIYWARSEMTDNLSEAIRYTEEVLRIQPKCALSHNNLAFFKAEQARLNYDESDPSKFKKQLSEASKSIEKAFEYVEKYYYSTLVDTKAYIKMLEGDFNGAKGILLKIAASDIGSRIHLALIFMTESEIYDKSECYLNRVLTKLHKQPWHRNYRIAKHLLKLIDEAKGGKAFKKNLLFYYHMGEIPASAYATAQLNAKLGEIRIPFHLVHLFHSIWSAFVKLLGLLNPSMPRKEIHVKVGP